MNPLVLSTKDGQETVVLCNVVFADARDITEQKRLNRNCTSIVPCDKHTVLSIA